MTQAQNQTLVLLRDAMNRYNFGSKEYRFAQNLFRHFHLRFLGRTPEEMAHTDRKSYEAIMRHDPIEYPLLTAMTGVKIRWYHYAGIILVAAFILLSGLQW